MENILYSSRALFCLLISTLLLAGCSHFQSEEETSTGEDGREQIVLYKQGDDGQMSAREPLSQLDLSPAALSNANVQVYSVDGTTPAGPGLHTMQQSPNTLPATAGDISYAGGVATGDPSVKVFPLDDEMARSMGLQGVPSGMPSVSLGPVEKVNLGAGNSLTPMSAPQAATPVIGPPISEQSPSASIQNGDVIRVYFDHDSSKLDAGDDGAIATAVERQQTGAGSVLNIEGHASVEVKTDDPIKRRIVNLKVSMDRAFAVARKLMEKGVPAEKIRTVGRGDTQPSAPVDGLDAVAASRRVEISSVSGQ